MALRLSRPRASRSRTFGPDGRGLAASPVPRLRTTPPSAESESGESRSTGRRDGANRRDLPRRTAHAAARRKEHRLMRPADASARSEDTDAVAAPSPSNPNARVCGDCTACCRVMAVSALGKSAGEPCRHQRGGGCGVYARRPEACREFHCLWLRDDRGIFDASHRPDRLGLVLGDRDDGTGARDADRAAAARGVNAGRGQCRGRGRLRPPDLRSSACTPRTPPACGPARPARARTAAGTR